MGTILQIIILNRSPMKGGEGCDDRKTEMAIELQLCFVLLPNGKRKMNKRGWYKCSLRRGNKDSDQVVTLHTNS